ncbi:MAG: hypothetical protein AAF353_10505 [Pseudomonadota bacterium]
MSIINNVLKDLEKRESHFTPIEVTVNDSQNKTQPGFSVSLVVPVAVMLVIVLSGGWYYQQQPVGSAALIASDVESSENDLVSSTPVQVSTSPPAETVAVVAAATETTLQMAEQPNQIVGLQIRESEERMRLEFALREKAISYLKQRGENRFSYHLRDVESEIVAPELSDNPWIEQLQIVTSQGGVDIQFKTVPDILVETRQSQSQGEQIWAIELVRQQKPETAHSVATRTIVEKPKTVAPAEEKVAVLESNEKQNTASSEKTAEVKLEIKSENPEVGSQNQLAYAVELMKSRRHADAEKQLMQLLGGEQDYRARQHLLGLYQHLKRPDRHSKLALQSVQRYPDDVVFSSEYARSLFQQGAYHSVIEMLANAEVRDASRQALLAASYQRVDQHVAAARYYELALRQDARNARNWIGLAISQEHNSEFEQALASYQTASNLGSLNQRLKTFVAKRSNTLKKVLN